MREEILRQLQMTEWSHPLVIIGIVLILASIFCWAGIFVCQSRASKAQEQIFSSVISVISTKQTTFKENESTNSTGGSGKYKFG